MSDSTERHDPSYVAFMRAKIEIARAELAAGKGIPGEEVEREFATLRKEVAAKIKRNTGGEAGSL